MKVFALFITILQLQFVNAQLLVEQLVINGAVSVNAVKSIENSNITLIPGVTVKKAWLISGNQIDNLIQNSNYVKTSKVNGITYSWSASTQATHRIHNPTLLYSGSIHSIDVTDAITSNIVFIENELMTFPPGEDVNQRFYCMALVVIYEDASLPEIGFSMWFNDKEITVPQQHFYSSINPINTANPVGFSLMTGHIVDTVDDGSFIKVNGMNLGSIGEAFYDELNGDFSAPIGQFQYLNNSITALSNDNSDLTMWAGDALSNISSITTNNATSINGEYVRKLNVGLGLEQTNLFWATFLAYTTPCQSFPVTTPKDTTLCQNSTLQLNATGGTPNSHSTSGYEWQPATGLSCTDCPNPVFTADSSMFYTVRIWNTDSCSVVRPLKINVRPQPVWDTVTVDSTICGASTGSATLFAQPNNSIVQSWTEVGGATQTSNIFQNLSGGNHTFYFTDTNGCQSADTVIFIPSTKPTVASFTANPISGASPLSVDFVNTSQQATNYAWSVNGINLGNSLPNFVFDSTGNYWVELVAWQNDPVCADTFVLLIIAYDSLVLQIPNVFSPNGDGTNDAYTLTSNVPVSVDYSIVNRWGQTMIAQTVQFGPGKTVLWDAVNSSTELTEGTYFYSIEATPTFDNGVIGKTVKLSGFLQLVR